MGERKGQNFYYPPDFDYKKHKSLNSYHGTHALRERAAKIKQGILIIRFEMPFNIWCLGCNNHIGMGVRYNAEKKKVGMYYTTPLYEFRMKCHLCDNYFVIRTDPEHFDYELVEGCRRQEKRYDPSTIDQLGAVDRGFNKQLEADKMFKVEHVEKDKEKVSESSDQVEKLEWIQERMRDDFSANQALRRTFRREKNELGEQRVIDDDLLKRSSLEIKLLPEKGEDRKLASVIMRYKNSKSEEERMSAIRASVRDRPLFTSSSKPSTSETKHKSPLALCRKRSLDPFEASPHAKSPSIANIGVVLKNKRKIDSLVPENASSCATETACPENGGTRDERRISQGKDQPSSQESTDVLRDSNCCPNQEGKEKDGMNNLTTNSCISLVADYGNDSSSGSDDG